MEVRQLSFLLILTVKVLHAQDLNTGSRITSMGNTGVALEDVWSLQSNPAGLTALPGSVASVTYQKNYPGTSLSTEAAVIALLVKKHAFGLSFQSFGFSAYKETRVGFAYARRFGETIRAALDFNFHQLSIPSYGSIGTFSVDAGFQYRPKKELLIGIHLSNLSNNGYGEESGAIIPISLSVGASYSFSKELLLSTAAVVSSNDRGGDFRTGLEYCLLRQLFFRAGIGLNPFKQYAGLGYVLQHFTVDLAMSNHLVLGYTPQISIAYVF